MEMTNDEDIIKKKTLDDIYYTKGKQRYDFELAGIYKTKNGTTRSVGGWKKYLDVCSNISNNQKYFSKVSCRQILPNELVIDIDDPIQISNIDNIVKEIENNGFYYECYSTGSKGYHIHLWFDDEVSIGDKEQFITIFGGDLLKKSKRTMIAIESIPHWKTGKKKTVYKDNKGTNNHQDLVRFLEWYIPAEYRNILADKDIFGNITEKELDKKIVGEKETRKVIFLCACGRLVKNCQIASYNLLVNDDAGTGKDYVTNAVLKILPCNVYVHKTRISPTVFTYWHRSDYEPDWTWDGKVFYPEDISETVLNSDVFKVLCSSGSSATITVRQKAVDIEINGKPVIITTTATAIPSPELTRRFVILNLDSSENQTEAIKKRHSEYAMSGIIPEYNNIYSSAMNFLKRVRVKIPFADKIDKHFPNKNITMRTNYPRFLDFIKASAAFHQYQREKDDENFILANGLDYEIARECFIKLCSNKYMISLSINQKKILAIFEKEPTLQGSVTQLHAKMNFLSVPALQTNLGILSKYGILKTTTGTDVYGRDIEEYGLMDGYKPNETISLPKYEELIK
jgi:hypothetical protein